jgi:hypothetical protein
MFRPSPRVRPAVGSAAFVGTEMESVWIADFFSHAGRTDLRSSLLIILLSLEFLVPKAAVLTGERERERERDPEREKGREGGL